MEDVISERNYLMTEFITRTLLELNAQTTSTTEEERKLLGTFTAVTLLKLYSNRGSAVQNIIAFNSDFYVKTVNPAVETMIASKSETLTDCHLVENRSISEKYPELLTEMKALTEYYRGLVDKIKNCHDLLYKVLTDRQWTLRQKIAKAEVHHAFLISTIYDKKLIKVCRSIHDIYRSYKFDEAFEKLSEQVKRETEELHDEIATRKKKHEIYLKVERITPDMNSLLESYQTSKQYLNNLSTYFQDS